MVPQVHMTCKPLVPPGRMLKGPIGTRRTEKGPSGDFYDELQVLWMSNYRSHRYTSHGERIEWRLLRRIVSVMDE